MNRILTSLLAVASLGCSGLAAAQDGIGVYVGAQASQAKYDESNFGEDTSTSLSGYVGYRFNDWLSIELGHGDFGEFDYEGRDGTTLAGVPADEISSGSIDVSANYLAVGLRGSMTDKLMVEASVGVYDSSTDVVIDGNNVEESTHSHLVYRADLLWPVTKNIDVKLLTWQYFSDLDGADLHNIGAGVQFNF